MHFGKGMENSHRSGIILLVGFSSLGHVHARGLVRHRNGRLDGALVDHQACIYLRHSLRADRRQCLLQPNPEFPRHQPVLFGNRRPALGIRSHLSDMDDDGPRQARVGQSALLHRDFDEKLDFRLVPRIDRPFHFPSKRRRGRYLLSDCRRHAALSRRG